METYWELRFFYMTNIIMQMPISTSLEMAGAGYTGIKKMVWRPTYINVIQTQHS